jgi:phospholipid transport system substrate-binding protein
MASRPRDSRPSAGGRRLTVEQASEQPRFCAGRDLSAHRAAHDLYGFDTSRGQICRSFVLLKRNRPMPATRPDRRTFLLLALGAAAVPALGIGRAAAAPEVIGPVEQLHAGLMTIMKAGRTAPFRRRYEMIAPVVDQSFDLATILRQAIGPRWASLPADQKTALEDAFRRYTTASYVANFDAYAGQRFEVAPVVRAVGGDRVVATRIVTASGEVHALDYVMRPENGGWKIVDVLAEGSISRVAAQRSEMRTVLAGSGGAGLLISLRQKTAELSGGILQ